MSSKFVHVGIPACAGAEEELPIITILDAACQYHWGFLLRRHPLAGGRLGACRSVVFWERLEGWASNAPLQSCAC